MKKLIVLLFVVMLFLLTTMPAFACGPNDNWNCEVKKAAAGWQKAGQQTRIAVNWAGNQVTSRMRQNQNARGGPWVLPSGASQPLQAGYDQFTNYAKNYK